MKKYTLVLDMKYHYTYRITNIKDGMYYYGVHSCDCLPQEDIGIKYFSSSKKQFIKDQKENPQDYKYKVVKIFCTRKEANKHEELLHNKFNVRVHEKFYNKWNANDKFDPSSIAIGNQHNKGRKHSKEVNMKKGSPGEKNGMYGKKHPLERVEKISKQIALSKVIKGICEHCGKEADKGNYIRWHSDNCKLNPRITEEQLLKREPWNKMKI